MPETNPKNVTARQHYVPQFYLRAFSDPNNGQLLIFNTRAHRQERPRISKSVCYENFFYAAETGDPDDLSQEVEHYFSRMVEHPIAQALPSILEKILKDKRVTDSERYTLSLLMCNMWLRTPAMRAQLNGMEEGLFRQTMRLRATSEGINEEIRGHAAREGLNLNESDVADVRNIMTSGAFNIDLNNASHLQFMLDPGHIEGFTNLFFGKFWTVHIARGEQRFVTSDNPVSETFPERPMFPAYGVSFLERIHVFPLSPQIAIEMTYPHRQAGKKLVRRTHFASDETAIARINLLSARTSTSYVYATNQREMDWFLAHSRSMLRQRDEILRTVIRTRYNR